MLPVAIVLFAATTAGAFQLDRWVPEFDVLHENVMLANKHLGGNCSLSTLLTWSQSHGATLKDAAFTEFLIDNVTDDGWLSPQSRRAGLVALQDLAPETVIFRGNKEKLALTVETALRSDIGFIFEENPHLHEFDVMVLHVMYESIKPDSFWQPYFCSMPRNQLPMFWGEDTLMERSKGQPDLEEDVRRMRKMVREDWNTMMPYFLTKYPKVFPRETFTMEHFAWSSGLVTWRAWTTPREEKLPTGEDTTHTLMPIADMFLFKESQLRLEMDGDDIVAVAKMKIAQGSEIDTDTTYVAIDTEERPMKTIPQLVAETQGDKPCDFAYLAEWAATHGLNISKKFEMADFLIEDVGVGDWRSGSITRRGVMALEAVPFGQEVISATCHSTSLCLSAISAERTVLKAIVESFPSIRQSLLLGLHVLKELSNPASFWQPYFCTIPTQAPLPIFFSDKALKAIKNESLVQIIADTRMMVREEWNDVMPYLNHVHPELFPSDVFNLPNFAWAMSIVQSRAWSLKDTKRGKTYDSIVPLMDMFNHQSGANPVLKSTASNGDETIAVVASADIFPGSEVFISYGNKERDKMFLNYGFFPSVYDEVEDDHNDDAEVG